MSERGVEKDAGIVAEDFRIEARDHSNDFRVYHEPCDMTLIVTRWVSLVTLVRLASEHTCVTSPDVSATPLAPLTTNETREDT